MIIPLPVTLYSLCFETLRFCRLSSLSLSLFFSSCRGGLKLEAAIEKLDVDVSEKVVLDSGLSTGGFTDCLLRYGAAHVYGVDVGYGQVLCIVQNRFFFP